MVRIFKNPITSAARGESKEQDALIKLAEERIAQSQDPLSPVEADLRFPVERDPSITPTHEGIDTGFDIDYGDDKDIVAIADDVTRRRTQPKTEYATPTQVAAVDIAEPSIGAEDITNIGRPALSAQAQGDLILKTRDAEAQPSIDQLSVATVPDGVSTYQDLDQAIEGAVNRLGQINEDEFSRAYTDPLLVHGVRKASEIVSSGGLLSQDQTSDVMTKVLTFSIFDSLLSRQVINDEKIERLHRNRDEGDRSTEAASRKTDETFNTEIDKLVNTGVNTQQNAAEIFQTAGRILASQQGLPPEQQDRIFDNLLPKEKSAIVDVLFQSLEDNKVLKRVEREGSDLGRSWLPTDSFDAIVASVPDLVASLGKAREKAPSDLPNPSGKSATAKGFNQKTTGRTRAEHHTAWNAKIDTALDFLGTQPWQIFNEPTDLELSFLQETLFYQGAANDSQFAVVGRNGTGRFANLRMSPTSDIGVAIEHQPMISDHPMAGFFNMDVDSFRSAFNKSRLTREAIEEKIAANRARGGTAFVPEPIMLALTNLVKTEEEFRETIKYFNNPQTFQSLTPFAQRLIINKLNNATSRFNSATNGYAKSPLEANAVRNTTKYSHHEQIGASGRIRISDNTINPQSTPADRSKVISTERFVVDPNKNGEVERNTKAMIARTFDLTTEINNPGGGTTTVPAEFLPRRDDREKIFNEYFSGDKAKGKVYLDAAASITGFGNKEWNVGSIVSDETTALLKESYEYIKQSRSVPGPNGSTPSKYNERAIEAFAVAGIYPGSGHINSPTLSIPQWENVAIALGVKKRKSDGSLVHGSAKEAGLHLNALLALGRWDKGLPFNGATLMTELDGTNNSFAILSILLGDVNLAKRAGLVNPDFSETGRVVSEGDMRQYVNGVAGRLIDSLKSKHGADEKKLGPILAMERVIQAINTTGSEKIAWKDIIMQAGYGKDFNSFAGSWVDQLSTDTAITDLVYDTDIEESSAFVKDVLGEALAPLRSYLKLTKDTGVWASILGGEYTYVSSAGMPVNLVDSAKSPLLSGHIDLLDTTEVASTTVSGVEKDLLADPFRVKSLPSIEGETIPLKQHPTRSSSEGSLTRFSEESYTSIAHALSSGETGPALFKELAKLTFTQRNRSPVNPIHGEDASVMIKTLGDISFLNKSKHKNDPIFTYQTFDAVTVNPRSYSIVPNLYNRNLAEIVSKVDRYGQDVQELMRIKREAVKSGDPRVALIMLNLSNLPEAEKSSRVKKINAAMAAREAAVNKVKTSISGDFPGGIVQGERFADYPGFEKKQRELNKAFEKALEDNKILPADMEHLFTNTPSFSAHIEALKRARSTMLHARKNLLKEAKKGRTSKDGLPLFLNVT